MELALQIIRAYISVLGREKWDSLTADEQHTVVMTVAKNMEEAYETWKKQS